MSILSPTLPEGKVWNGKAPSPEIPLPPVTPNADNSPARSSGKRADLIWTRGDFLAICEHMHNCNPYNHFLSGWSDDKGVHYSKSSKTTVQKRASWTWDLIIGKARGNTTIGFYASNPNGCSHWGAIDFDAHDGNWERARALARNAYALLEAKPDLFTILCHSGRGYHVFVFARELRPIRPWILLLKEICFDINANISPGMCEIFPNDRAESQKTGKAIRAPGTLNPSTGQPSLIEKENVSSLLEALPRSWSAAKRYGGGSSALSLYKSIYNYSSDTRYHSPTTEGLIKEIIARYPVERVGTRNTVLMSLVGDLVHKFGREAAENIIKLHYETYRANIRTSWDEHLEEFCNAWNGMVAKIVKAFSPLERERYNELNSDHQEEGFRIVRSFAGAAAHKGRPDFPVARASLADRLSITPPGAAGVVGKLVELECISQAQAYSPHKHPACYCWLFGETSNLPQGLTEAHGLTFSKILPAATPHPGETELAIL